MRRDVRESQTHNASLVRSVVVGIPEVVRLVAHWRDAVRRGKLRVRKRLQVAQRSSSALVGTEHLDGQVPSYRVLVEQLPCSMIYGGGRVDDPESNGPVGFVDAREAERVDPVLVVGDAGPVRSHQDAYRGRQVSVIDVHGHDGVLRGTGGNIELAHPKKRACQHDLEQPFRSMSTTYSRK